MIGLSLFIGVTFYFPVVFGVDEAVETQIAKTTLSLSIRAPEIEYLTSIAASILLPLLLDTFLDLMSVGLDSILLERGYFLVAIFFSFVGQAITNSTSIATTFYGCSFILQLWILCSTSLIILNRVSAMFSFWRVAVLLCLSYVYGICQICLLAYESNTAQVIGEIFKYISLSSILIINIMYLTCTVRDSRNSKLPILKLINSMDGNTHTGVIASLGLVLSILIYALLAISFDSQNGILYISKKFLVMYLCLSIVLCLVLTIIPQRFLKAHAHRVLSELELKKTFVRYISHELRTPMSICLTGLDLAEEQVKRGAPVREILAIIRKLKQPCLTGVEILNKLLDFEKLEAGMTVLEKSKQDPTEFLSSTIEPFYLVARMKNVELKVTSELVAGRYNVNVDETKVRNPVSDYFILSY